MYNYTAQAEQFLTDTGTTMYAERGHKEPLWKCKGTKVYDGHNTITLQHGRHWSITLVNSRGRFTFDYWESIDSFVKAAGRGVFNRPPVFKAGAYYVEKWLPETHYLPPTAYDVLACLNAYCPLDFAEFCAEFGYSTDSISARDTWQECIRQRASLERMYTPEQLEALAEIN